MKRLLFKRNLLELLRLFISTAISYTIISSAMNRGAPDNNQTQIYCVLIAVGCYMLIYFADRAIGAISPIIIDARSFDVDRYTPGLVIINASDEYPIKLIIDEDNAVSKMNYEYGVIFASKTREFCYLRVAENTYLKICAEMGSALLNAIPNISAKTNGLSFQV